MPSLLLTQKNILDIVKKREEPERLVLNVRRTNTIIMTKCSLSDQFNITVIHHLFRSVRLRELALPSRRSFDVHLSSGSKARVQLFLPPSWREELRDAAFPVLVQV